MKFFGNNDEENFTIIGRKDFWDLQVCMIPPDLIPSGSSMEFDIINSNKNSAIEFLGKHPIFCKVFGDIFYQKDEESLTELTSEDLNIHPDGDYVEKVEKLEYIPTVSEVDEIIAGDINEQEMNENMDRIIEDFKNNVFI